MIKQAHRVWRAFLTALFGPNVTMDIVAFDSEGNVKETRQIKGRSRKWKAEAKS